MGRRSQNNDALAGGASGNPDEMQHIGDEMEDIPDAIVPGKVVGSAIRKTRKDALADIPAPNRYRVEGLDDRGRMFLDRSGKRAKMLPNKIIDSRYHDIKSLRAQGFKLVDLAEEEKAAAAAAEAGE